MDQNEVPDRRISENEGIMKAIIDEIKRMPK
jgi:hypothetical protein